MWIKRRAEDWLFYNQWLARILSPPVTPYNVFLNSMPKAGTHLLDKALTSLHIRRLPYRFGVAESENIPGYMLRLFWNLYPEVRLARRLGVGHSEKWLDGQIGGDKVDCGIAFSRWLLLEDAKQFFKLGRPGWYTAAHCSYSVSLDSILRDNNIKMLFIIRDPRGIIFSDARFLAEYPHHIMHDYYRSLPLEERIMATITGVPAGPGRPRMLNIRERVTRSVAWMEKQYCYTTYFEKLVGVRGGGARDAQIQELSAIADHLCISVKDSELASIANSLFGGTRTFNKGVIGGWREAFTLEHCAACKDMIGDLLIDLGYESDTNW